MWRPWLSAGLVWSGIITNRFKLYTHCLTAVRLYPRLPPTLHPAGLVGSGIITKQFKEIRQTVMDTVLETFFDAEFLANYIGQKAAALEESNYIQSKIKTILEGDDVDAILDKHLDGLMLKPEGVYCYTATLLHSAGSCLSSHHRSEARPQAPCDTMLPPPPSLPLVGRPRRQALSLQLTQVTESALAFSLSLVNTLVPPPLLLPFSRAGGPLGSCFGSLSPSCPGPHLPGMMLAMVGMTGQSLKPMVKPFVMGMDAEIAPMLTSYLDPSAAHLPFPCPCERGGGEGGVGISGSVPSGVLSHVLSARSRVWRWVGHSHILSWATTTLPLVCRQCRAMSRALVLVIVDR